MEYDLNRLNLLKILEKGNSIIIKYQIESKKEIQTFVADLAMIEICLSANKGEGDLIDLLIYWLSIEKKVEIISIQKHERKEYTKKDFLIKRFQEEKRNGNNLIYAYIKNRVTGIELQTWFRPSQINTKKGLNDLICWEDSGKEITSLYFE